MKTSDFDYSLPAGLIAQTPVEPRDHSRLMVLTRSDGSLKHGRFFELAGFLRGGDVLVFNDSRVISARLMGRKANTGGGVEILLLRRLDKNIWEALVKPGRRVNVGARIEITNNTVTGSKHGPRVLAEVKEQRQDGIKVLSFSDETLLSKLGRVPLPPYIYTPLAHPERYQTVYARVEGSVAAPTAGLHFTPQLLGEIERKGVHCLFVTLHVGLDTFRPVREDNPLQHAIHREYGVLSQEAVRQLSEAKQEGRRVICVGTTTVRLLEQAANPSHSLEPFQGWINLFILPGYQFRLADALITNFHLPRSTLLMLVSAFAGQNFITRAYEEAIAEKYRFYSFGDAMLIL